MNAAAALCFENPEDATDDDLRKIYPKPDVLRERIEILYELGIGD